MTVFGRTSMIPAIRTLSRVFRLFVMALLAIACRRTEQQARAYTPAEVSRADSLLTSNDPPTTDEFGYPKDTLDRRDVIRLLGAGDYPALEGLLETRWERTRHDVRYELHLYNAYEAFFQKTPATGAAINRWLAARPESPEAHFARAYHHLARAWESRGEDDLRNTPRSNRERMGSYAEMAVKEAVAGLEMDPDNLIGYHIVLMTLQFEGWSRDYAQALGRALEAHPTSWLLRVDAMRTLLPAWGGSYEGMAALANEASDYIDHNRRLATLAGWPDAEKGRMLRLNDQHDKALEYHNQALTYGAGYFLLVQRAQTHAQLGNDIAALADLNMARQQIPQGQSMLRQRGRVLARIAVRLPPPLRDSAFARALEDFMLIEELQLPGENASDWIAWTIRKEAECAHQPAPC